MTQSKITEDICKEILSKLEEKCLDSQINVQFRSYWHDLLEAHVIAVNNYDFYFSGEFTNFLCELEDHYADLFDLDIFDIYFVFEVFENKTSQIQVSSENVTYPNFDREKPVKISTDSTN